MLEGLLPKEEGNFDEQPNFNCPLTEINLNLAKELFAKVSKTLTDRNAKSLGLIVDYQAKEFPSNATVLLFADH